MNVSVIPEDDEPARDGGGSVDGGGLPICVLLRESREAAGYSIADVSQLLRIQRQYLAAIEEGRYSDLPGSVYAIGFVRTYSDFLNLDADDVVRRFKNEAADLSRPTDYVFPVNPTEARVPGFAVLVIGVLLAAIAYSAWYLYAGDEGPVPQRASDVPARVSDLASRSARVDPPAPAAEPTPVIAPEAADAAAAPTTDPAPPASAPPVTMAAADPDPALPKSTVPPAETAEPAEWAPAPSSSPMMAAPQPSRFAQLEPPRFAPLPETAAAPAPVPAPAPTPVPAPAQAAVPPAPQPPPAIEEREVAERSVIAPQFAESSPPPPPPAVQVRQPRTYGLRNADSRVLIRATEMSWVQITDDQGNLVMTQVLEPGDSYRVPSSEGLILASGNAGGLQIEVDGEVLPPLGLRGVVVRNVPLAPDALIDRAGN